jgi:hypothetical protein
MVEARALMLLQWGMGMLAYSAHIGVVIRTLHNRYWSTDIGQRRAVLSRPGDVVISGLSADAETHPPEKSSCQADAAPRQTARRRTQEDEEAVPIDPEHCIDFRCTTLVSARIIACCSKANG